MTANGSFTHGAMLYEDLPGFLAGTVPFLQEGIAVAEPALVAVPPHRAEVLRSVLPDANGAVRFVDMTEVGRNPGRIISAWADFLAEHSRAPRVRGIGEPIWHGRTQDEIAECQRHETLLNVAFSDRPGFTLMCPYDRTLLEDSVLAAARSSHPVLVQDGEAVPSEGYDGRVAPLSGTLPEPSVEVEVLDLADHSLIGVRRRVTDRAVTAGLAPDRTADLVLAVTEAATNSRRHAGDGGELRLWHVAGRFVCEVRDPGRIIDPLAGRFRVPVDASSGRGLWLIHQLCDLVQIRSSEAGSVVRMHMATG